MMSHLRSKKLWFTIVVILIIVWIVLSYKRPVEPFIYKDLVVVTAPREGEKVGNPIHIEGQARGSWFFEASFPIIIADWDGKIIGEGYAVAQADWMTEEYVPFKADVEYDKNSISGNYSQRAVIIFEKDNPSGLPEHDDAFEISVVLK